MDTSHFDHLARSLATAHSRRRIFGAPVSLLAAMGLAASFDEDGSAARRKKRRRRRRKRQRRARRCQPGSLATICAGACGTISNQQSCGSPVDCGPCGQAAACDRCAGNELCQPGGCTACTVTCPVGQTPAQCGDALRAALGNTSLRTILVCPGVYEGGFTIERGLTLVGAGQGNNPASDTILTANQAGRVVWVTDAAGPVTINGLRVTGGKLSSDSGAGILHMGTSLTMTACTVTENAGNGVSGVGIYSLSRLQLTDCTISDNVCQAGNPVYGGGLFLQGPTTLNDCQITGNETNTLGGGILVGPATVSLMGKTTVSGNTAAGGGGIMVTSGGVLNVGASCKVTHNLGTELFGGIANEGSVTLQGANPSAIVVNNCPSNCSNVPGCTETQIDCPGN